MKTFRPSPIRGFTACFNAVFWTSLAAAVVVGGLHFLNWTERMSNPRSALPLSVANLIDIGLLATFAVILVLLSIERLLWAGSIRYEVGPSDLVLHRGALWRHTSTMALVMITRIESSSGPVSRLFGLCDLHIFTAGSSDPHRNPGGREVAAALLVGLRNGEEVRHLLLERRDQLHEAVLLGDCSVARTPQDLQMHRLTTAIERLERRFPAGRG
jgi:membrane protein YdbS with pleckstrin-like domain